MKTTKMSLATMQDKMSRSEMKMLVGGLEDTLGGDGDFKCMTCTITQGTDSCKAVNKGECETQVDGTKCCSGWS